MVVAKEKGDAQVLGYFCLQRGGGISGMDCAFSQFATSVQSQATRDFLGNLKINQDAWTPIGPVFDIPSGNELLARFNANDEQSPTFFKVWNAVWDRGPDWQLKPMVLDKKAISEFLALVTDLPGASPEYTVVSVKPIHAESRPAQVSAEPLKPSSGLGSEIAAQLAEKAAVEQAEIKRERTRWATFSIGQSILVNRGDGAPRRATIVSLYSEHYARVQYEDRSREDCVMGGLFHPVSTAYGFHAGDRAIQVEGANHSPVRILAIYEDGTAYVVQENERAKTYIDLGRAITAVAKAQGFSRGEKVSALVDGRHYDATVLDIYSDNTALVQFANDKSTDVRSLATLSRSDRSGRTKPGAAQKKAVCVLTEASTFRRVIVFGNSIQDAWNDAVNQCNVSASGARHSSGDTPQTSCSSYEEKASDQWTCTLIEASTFRNVTTFGETLEATWNQAVSQCRMGDGGASFSSGNSPLVSCKKI